MHRPHKGDGRLSEVRGVRGLCWADAEPAVPTPDVMAQEVGNGVTDARVLRALIRGRGIAPRGGHPGSSGLVRSRGPFLSGGSVSILLTVCYTPLTPAFSTTLLSPILTIC